MLGISKNHIKCETQQLRQYIQILLNCEKKENQGGHGGSTEATEVLKSLGALCAFFASFVVFILNELRIY